ncbi:MAG: right-handed parallel beta-helix repeat-containing protein [Solirubrobacterales bacterium]
MRDLRRAGALSAAAAAVALALAPSASGDTSRPNRLGDHAPDGCTPGDCSLREAVIRANNHPGADTILLRSGRTYTLSRVGRGEDAARTGDLDVKGNLTIAPARGRVATIDAIDGDDDPAIADRVLEIVGDHRLALRSLAIVDGGPLNVSGGGGGVNANSGTLLVTRCLFKRDDNAAISTGSGDLTISRSTFTRGPDGGIVTFGGEVRIVRSTVAHNGDNGIAGAAYFGTPTVQVVRSRVIDNTLSANGADGAGIWVFGRVVISKSTVAGNHATGDGGGVYNDDKHRLIVRDSTISGNSAENGGGIHNDGGTVQLVNVTLAGNRASEYGGGISQVPGAVARLNAVTVARNTANDDGAGGEGGGGLSGDSGAAYEIRNSLIALNEVGTGGTGPDCLFGAPQASKGHNLFGDAAGCLGLPGPTDLVRSNPRIGRLADNGGPTETIALRKRSAAIGHASKATSPKRDQRGVSRDEHPDSGAFERRS